MKIASIDIGTNAVKSKIFKTTPTSIEFIEGIRSPIRLGTDVFTNGLLTKDAFSRIGMGIYRTKIVREIWEERRGDFEPDFAEFFEELRDKE